MCPVRNVTYVSGRSKDLRDSRLSVQIFGQHPVKVVIRGFDRTTVSPLCIIQIPPPPTGHGENLERFVGMNVW
jgi:hypothetical protein